MDSAQKTVLVVDDEIALVKALEAVLKSEGYKVVTASDGEEGFKVCQARHPDLVLLDILMPHLDGLGMLEKLRTCKDDFCKHVPVIILTNLTNEDFEKNASKLNAPDYVIKSDTDLKSIVAMVHKKLKSLE